jgi:hypothetical protein
LRNDYPISKVSGKGAVIQAGIVVTLQQDGMKAVPGTYHPYGNHIKKGERIKQNMLQQPGIHRDYLTSARFLQVGERAYVTKIEVKDSEVLFEIQTCGNCDPGAPEPSPYRGSLAVQFQKGYLSTMDAQAIEATINQVLAASSTATAPPPENPPAPQQAPQQQQPEPQPQAQPATIEIGQTTDQVLSALGKPDRIAKVGTKEIYVYKDLKVTFIDGKVSDVQ